MDNQLEQERFTSVEHYRMVAEHYARIRRLSEVHGNIEACVEEMQQWNLRNPSKQTRRNRSENIVAMKRELDTKVVGKVLTPDEQLAIAMKSLERNEK